MQPLRFIMVGGFLGSGKTTTIARLARAYLARGQSVGIVTNDQASELVDTHNLRSQGFNVGEIPGACFCGNLSDLTGTVDRLGLAARPDVILVEPVGSCTDLVASVVRPLQRMYSDRFDVAPYGVLLKPSHGTKILRGEPRGGFSPQAEYIFRKQLEEADFVAINRVDVLTSAQIEELTSRLQEAYPDTPVLRTSAKTGAGFDALLEFLDQRGQFGQRILEIDYQQYAAGEAALGWLNGAYLVRGAEPFELDRLLLDVVSRLRESLGQAGTETAHLKMIGLWQGISAVANLIAAEALPELSVASWQRVPRAHLIINARVSAEPDLLDAHVSQALDAACREFALTVDDRQTQSFRPGSPTRNPPGAVE